ncbi:MAG: hypothetical protein BZY80_02250 [SAR202 cluster bacterium Io17-Chloro-G2]|nr:MAG: hypothetical protein BZY80_02250 [SAR202 cluster bacterium Io17-Chloro-G2]
MIWIFIGLIAFLAFLELIILGLIVFLTIRFDEAKTRDTRENLWKGFTSILGALIGLVAGRGLS